MRSLNAATLYPGIAMLEASKNLSVGRGTDSPFEQIGADWIDGPALAEYMNTAGIPGVRFHPVEFTPASSNFSGKKIPGIGIELTDRERFSAAKLGTELALALVQRPLGEAQKFQGRADIRQRGDFVARQKRRQRRIIGVMARGHHREAFRRRPACENAHGLTLPAAEGP